MASQEAVFSCGCTRAFAHGRRSVQFELDKDVYGPAPAMGLDLAAKLGAFCITLGPEEAPLNGL